MKGRPEGEVWEHRFSGTLLLTLQETPYTCPDTNEPRVGNTCLILKQGSFSWAAAEGTLELQEFTSKTSLMYYTRLL